MESKKKSMFGSDYNPHNFVFSTELGDVFDPRTYMEIFYKVIRASGIKHANFHSLRHTYATRCIQQGIDPTVLSKLMGHAKVSTSMDMYTHAEDDELMKASAVFSRNKA